jgi:hypothetical protein
VNIEVGAVIAVASLLLGLLHRRDDAQQKQLDEIKRDCRDLRAADGKVAAVPALLEGVQKQIDRMDEKIDRLLERRGSHRNA